MNGWIIVQAIQTALTRLPKAVIQPCDPNIIGITATLHIDLPPVVRPRSSSSRRHWWALDFLYQV